MPARRRAAARHRLPSGPGFQARRLAMLALFEEEFRPDRAAEALERLAAEKRASTEVQAHAARIVEGVLTRRPELDAEIARHAPAIPVSELGRVERTILRSALWEVLYSAATPSGETIHDAVALARTYAGDAARRLVNGVLGSVVRSSGSGASGRGA
ncbi:MAG TPA: transcription antitermination factor NusB [candidate division Zixibacteria bacterium]|nr:transcription antitermination factor NusB [candidate division Zixibacteria bacterium]